MRIAVLIIGLCLVMLIGLQSCTVMVGGGLTEDKSLSGGGAIGLLIAFLFIVGSGLAIGVPKASMIVFGIAAFLGIAVGASSSFSDLIVWGVVALVLSVMSFYGIKEKKRKEGYKEN